jgi:hypothetical protein
MLVKVVACTTYGHNLRIGCIAYGKSQKYAGLDARDYQGASHWSGGPLEQALASCDVRRIPHNKANLRAFAKQQKHFYKKR